MRLPGRCSAPWVSLLSGLPMLKGPLVDLQERLAEQRTDSRKVVYLAKTQLVPVSTPTLASSPAGAPIPPSRLIPSLSTMVIERQNHSITSPEALLRLTAWRGVTRGLKVFIIVLIHHPMNTTITARLMIITLVIIITTTILAIILTEDSTVLTVIAEIIPMKLICITLITETIRVLAIIITVQKATIQSIPITVETTRVQVIITIMGTIII